MASMKCKRESSPSPSSSSTRECKYEVFLSFRGEDTRNNFTDHLYAALNRMGIITFRDEEELERGKSISKLFEAIEESQIAIIIFSKSYASSKWCLDELAKINKCREEMRLEVFPIFYDVDPSDVRKQIGNFEQTFIDHQKCEDNIKKVETWRTALKEVANISGWHLQNRHESEFIQHVVKEMMKKLSSKSSGITRNFIGMDSTLKEFIPLYLGFENNVRMTGIYGMGGLGKTTLARAVYDEYRSHFEGSSFIANVREDSKTHGLRKLQKQLLADILEDKNIHVNNVYDGVDTIKKRLCRIKVLIVIDDVDHLDQLEKLAGGHDWFGLGSWIIITTRDEHVLIQHEVLNRYNSNGLKDDDALKLFCLKAFKNEKPKEGYMQLSLEVVKYANGLPLALVTLGSFLVGRTIDEWQSALPSFKKTKGEIFHILKLSYDGLEEMWKEIFLDIACFFRHWNKNEVIHILENCGFNARIGISVLMEKSLLSMDYNEDLGMHDLLQEMGEKIVRFESKGKLGMQSRLWLNNDLLNVLKDNMATNAIEAIVVRYKKVDFKFEEFLEVLSKMSNLRLMIINQTDILRFPIDHRHLDVPTTLRHLLWDYCPLKCLSCSSQPMELVHLELQRSYLEYLWQGVMDGTIYGTSSKREKEGSRTKFLVIIPSFFIQKVRNSINIELPSNWYNSKWIGFALWATCMIGCEYDIRARVIALGDMPQNYWAFELFTTLIRLENSICLLYLSSDEWFAIVGNGKCCQIKVIFETNRSTIGIDVSDCGFSSLYKQDVDEFNQTSAQCLIESFGEEVPIYKLTVGDDDDDDDEL
ncbi:TMV resistance protein N-like isoform X7 [Quercus lobata]|uniref:TMV resistance protein N-like isoform X7 n=1 Tax=Quercus lobata TaxID=97700 RepID=UPI001248D507|nr:TMV resistance protein N-like isoform X7 [Quercus lobata]